MAHRQRAQASPVPLEKICAACGRTIQWRKKWASNWDAVRYCSDACRRNGVSETDRRLEAAIVALLAERQPSATILASDAAKAVGGVAWQELTEPARRAARRLVVAGAVDIVQNGVVVDPSTVKGPMHIRRAR